MESSPAFFMEAPAQSGRAPGGDILRGTLQRIPTVFGRLVYLSSLRNQSSGRYEHEALEATFGSDGADHALRNRHRQIFSEWMERNLEDQKRDLVEYLSSTAEARGAVGELERIARYRNLVPPAAKEVERLLYFTDLETVLDLLRVEHGAGVWRQGA